MVQRTAKGNLSRLGSLASNADRVGRFNSSFSVEIRKVGSSGYGVRSTAELRKRPISISSFDVRLLAFAGH